MGVAVLHVQMKKVACPPSPSVPVGGDKQRAALLTCDRSEEVGRTDAGLQQEVKEQGRSSPAPASWVTFHQPSPAGQDGSESRLLGHGR